jgi:hypothetical protein
MSEPRVLELAGTVEFHEEDYGDYNEDRVGPLIGGVTFIDRLHEVFPETRLGRSPRSKLTVMLASGGDPALYYGTAWACDGDPHYSTLTPASSPDIWVGGPVEGEEGRWTDLYSKLRDLEGQTVHLRVDDIPHTALQS